MASEITKEFIGKIEVLISKKDDQALLNLLSEEHPADIAEIIDDLDLKDATYLFKLLDSELSAEALLEIDEDDLSIFDIERVILNGEIIERQKDEERSEWKYLVRGRSIDGHQVIVVVKLGPNDKMIIITVFKDE